MARAFTLLAAGLALAGPAGTACAQTRPAPPPPIAGQQADARAEATRLAAVLLPDVAFNSLIQPMFDNMLESRLATEPLLRKFLAERPEIRAAKRRTVVPAIQAILSEALPAWRAELRDMLMTRLSGDEARTLADFLASPAGQKLYVGAMTYAANHPEVEKADDKMMAELMATLTPADIATVNHFATLPVAAKFGAVTAATSPMLVRWGQDVVRDQGPRLKQIIEDAMKPYFAPSRKQP